MPFLLFLLFQAQSQPLPDNSLQYGVWALVASVVAKIILDNSKSVVEWWTKDSEAKSGMARAESAAESKRTQDITQNMLTILQQQINHSQDMHIKSTESLHLSLSALSDAVNNPKELVLKIEALSQQIESGFDSTNTRIDWSNQRLTGIEGVVKIDPKRTGRKPLNDALDSL